MTYMINVWDIGVSCLFRTDILEEWLKAIKKLDEKYKFTKRNCRWSKTGDITIFSFCKNNVTNEWAELRYLRKPDFVFYGIPEGVKYV